MADEKLQLCADIAPHGPHVSGTWRCPGQLGSLPKGTCTDRRHASQHPAHLAEVDGRAFWCVGGFVRADGTIPLT